jgi:hypothetical protein
MDVTLPAETIVRIRALLASYTAWARGHGDPRPLNELNADAITALILGDTPLPDDLHTDYPGDGDSAEDLATTIQDWFTTQFPDTDAPDDSVEPAAAETDERPDEPDETIVDEATGYRVDPTTGEIHDPPAPTRRKAKRRKRARRRMERPSVPIGFLVAASLDTLTGLANEPGYLHGFGPICADQVRQMAHDTRTTATWRCAAVSNDHQTLLGLGTKTYTPNYKPSAKLKRFTNSLYREQCAFPTCSTRALYCDWEHTTPHPAGATCSCNGIPLCRRCHRLKTTGLIDVQILNTDPDDPNYPPGTLIWTTASGRRHLQRPPALTPRNQGQLTTTAIMTGGPPPPPF